MDERDVFENRVRERAFHLWEEAGCPENTAEEFWHRAYAIELEQLNLTPKQLDDAARDEPPASDAADFA